MNHEDFLKIFKCISLQLSMYGVSVSRTAKFVKYEVRKRIERLSSIGSIKLSGSMFFPFCYFKLLCFNPLLFFHSAVACG